MHKKYRVLRLISAIYKIMGWLILVLGVVSGCISVVLGFLGSAGFFRGSEFNPLTGLLGGLALVVLAVLCFLSLYAAA